MSTSPQFDPQLLAEAQVLNIQNNAPDIADEILTGSFGLFTPVLELIHGLPTTTESTDVALQNMRNVALAGGSPQDQLDAYNGTFKDVQGAALAFNQHSPYSNPLQRAFDAAVNTSATDPWSGVVPKLTNLIDPADWLPEAGNTTLGIVLIVAGLLVGFLILKEVL